VPALAVPVRVLVFGATRVLGRLAQYLGT